MESSILVVDSSTRDPDLYPSSAEYSIPIGKVHGLCGADILDASIPASQTGISERNNTLTYAIDSAGTITSVAVPPGTYTEASLVATIQDLVASDGLVLNITDQRVRITHPTSDFRVYLNRPSSIHACLGIHTKAAYVMSLSREYAAPGKIDVTGGSRYIRVHSNLAIHEHVPDQCEPGMGLYMLNNEHAALPWVRYPTRLYDRPRSVNSIGIRLENPDGSLYETGQIDHVLVVRLWRASTESPQTPADQAK
jgi:hypothetical protein